MSKTTAVIVVLVFVTFIGSITIFSKIGSMIGELPQSTPIDIPNALRKTDKTFATSSATLAPTASPDHYATSSPNLQ